MLGGGSLACRKSIDIYIKQHEAKKPKQKSSFSTSQPSGFLAGVRTPVGAQSVFGKKVPNVTRTGPHQTEPDGIIHHIKRGRKGALIFLVFMGRVGARIIASCGV